MMDDWSPPDLCVSSVLFQSILASVHLFCRVVQDEDTKLSFEAEVRAFQLYLVAIDLPSSPPPHLSLSLSLSLTHSVYGLKSEW